jgi:hypothetical protein
MTDCFKVEFHSDTTLMVYEKGTAWDGRLALIQPFNPQTGKPWSNEQEALDWWETVKHQYVPPVPVIIEEEQSQEELNG